MDVVIRPVLALATIVATLSPLGPASAQERRFFVVSPGPVVMAPVAVAPTSREANRLWLCPNGGAPVRGRPGRCDARAARSPGGASAAGVSEVAGWFADLPPATRRQVACPAGTVAGEARANPGTVRCVPAG